MEPKIIYEDSGLMVVDKPAGWITNEADTTTNQPVLQTWVKENFDFPVFENPEYRNGIVHRLDKETSGILLIAKTKDMFETLQSKFKEREIKKTYIALVHGKLKPEEGEINVTVGRLPWRRERFGILPGGRESLTKYKVVSYYELPWAKPHLKVYSLVEFYPQTGRTHQIRIHAKHMGHPIVGDEFYAGRKTARDDRKWCPRLFLHASGISFQNLLDSKLVKFISKLPIELTDILDKLVLK